MISYAGAAKTIYGVVAGGEGESIASFVEADDGGEKMANYAKVSEFFFFFFFYPVLQQYIKVIYCT